VSAAQNVRLFFALWPTAAVREQFAAIAARLAHADAVPAPNYHLTIAFVGEVPLGRVAALRAIGAGLRVPHCRLSFDALEYWPKPEVVVAAVRDIPSSLALVWQDLHAQLATSQFVLAPKRLRPHVTLARKVLQAPDLAPIAAVAWEAEQFCLVRSQSGSAHSIYTVVDTWPLLDSVEK
jgi:2'-5' RNA ligase